MIISNRALFIMVVAGVITYQGYKPLKKLITSKPMVGNVKVEMFSSTNSTIIGNIGDVQGDLNVKN